VDAIRTKVRVKEGHIYVPDLASMTER